ncbi:MAG: hypothetical protein EXR64_02725 [Dehalococcoidia bacterium]|nr:hypothetical protein [Dehalococcoidia bacterium]
MPQQYVASDSRTGLQVQVTGEFPGEPDDRVRIARTTNLFTRLMATILSTEDEADRRERFRAIETQLEVAEALVRGDLPEVERLVRETLHHMGISDEQLREVEQQLRRQMQDLGGDANIGGLGGLFHDPEAPPEDDPPADAPPSAPRA